MYDDDVYRRVPTTTATTTAAGTSSPVAASPTVKKMIHHNTTGIHQHQQQQHHHRRRNNSVHRRSHKNDTIATIVQQSWLSLLQAQALFNKKSCCNIISYSTISIIFFFLGTRYQSKYVCHHQQQQLQNCHEIQCDEACLLKVYSSSLSNVETSKQRLPKQLEQLVKAMAHTSKQEFTNIFDLGVPIDVVNTNQNSGTDNLAVINYTDNVLFIYPNIKTIPTRILQQHSSEHQQQQKVENATALPPTSSSSLNDDAATIVPLLPITEAVENCDIVNVILTSSTHGSGTKQCLAIIPQYENSHIMKFMRMTRKRYEPQNILLNGGQTNADDDEHVRTMNMLFRDADANIHPNFELIATTHKPNGRVDFRIPSWDDETMVFWKILQTYLTNVSTILKEIQELITTSMNIIKSNDIHTNNYYIDSTVIVMVCNYGQSELLVNFVCTARSRHIDISNILVFTTDVETTNIVTALGLHCYYDHRNFGSVPKGAANQYGDPNFVAMMMAKVICVQLVSMLQYNILFQDVDVIWYRHPLQYFDTHKIDMNQYDIIFQDDGGRSTRYAPYSANTGFYYVRYNDRTRHFFTSLFMSGDVVLSTHSHQQVMIALLKEHVSLFGLKVKVLSRDTDEFPGGFHYHQRSKVYMKKLFAGKVKPYIFHMSWTFNKDNKILFLRQMGEWYVHEKCIDNGVMVDATIVENASDCCSTEPIFSCHYRDKPSIKPCITSPSIDKNRRSWW